MKERTLILRIYFTIILFICLVALGCKKYIYQGPITSTYSTEFWTSQASVEQAINSMYGQLRSNLVQPPGSDAGTFFLNGDMVSGSFENVNRQDYMPFTAAQNPFGTGPFNFNYTPYNKSLHDWSSFYQLLAQCNLILQNVPKMSTSLFTSEDIKNSYLGEALFMRAYTYFYITRIWGDPVVVNRTYDGSDYGNIPPLPRTSETIVLDSCILDLIKASNYLDFANKNGVSSPSLRANKGTVFALLAHIYAWKHDYVNAHQACLKVINNGGYSLESLSNYKNIWSGQSSLENIFELSMTYQPNDPNFTNQGTWAEAKFEFFGVFLKGTIVDNVRNSSWTTPPSFIPIIWDTANDLRFKIDYTFYPAGNGDPDGYMLLKYTNFKYGKPETKTFPYVNNNLVLFRLSDIILLDAEALASTGDLAGAKADLEKTESRAGITTYQTPTNQFDMMNEIIKERGRELVGEGQWYYDLIRTEGKQGWLELVGYPHERVSQTNKGYYWPLALDILLPQDNLLTQNPWWATHTD